MSWKRLTILRFYPAEGTIHGLDCNSLPAIDAPARRCRSASGSIGSQEDRARMDAYDCCGLLVRPFCRTDLAFGELACETASWPSPLGTTVRVLQVSSERCELNRRPAGDAHHGALARKDWPHIGCIAGAGLAAGTSRAGRVSWRCQSNVTRPAPVLAVREAGGQVAECFGGRIWATGREASHSNPCVTSISVRALTLMARSSPWPSATL